MGAYMCVNGYAIKVKLNVLHYFEDQIYSQSTN